MKDVSTAETVIVTAQVEPKAANTIPLPVEPEQTERGGVRPLFKVRYTSKAGNTETYGVSWNGLGREDVHRLGLRRLTKKSSFVLMARWTRYAKGFYVDADKCELV